MLLCFQRRGQQAPDASYAGAGRQVPGLCGRLRGLGARHQPPGLGQVHELRPDLRGARLRHLQQGKRKDSIQTNILSLYSHPNIQPTKLKSDQIKTTEIWNMIGRNWALDRGLNHSIFLDFQSEA